MRVALNAIGWTLFAVVAVVVFIAVFPFLFWWGIWKGITAR